MMPKYALRLDPECGARSSDYITKTGNFVNSLEDAHHFPTLRLASRALRAWVKMGSAESPMEIVLVPKKVVKATAEKKTCP